MNNYVRKRLTANDLGITGAHQAGIAIPKNTQILSFFPSLCPTEYNPDCLISVLVPELEEYVTLRFVYYNNKLHEQGTRNEYRLTGTTGILRRLNADVSDEIEFSKDFFGEMRIRIIRPVSASKTEGKSIQLSNGWSFSVSED